MCLNNIIHGKDMACNFYFSPLPLWLGCCTFIGGDSGVVYSSVVVTIVCVCVEGVMLVCVWGGGWGGRARCVFCDVVI